MGTEAAEHLQLWLVVNPTASSVTEKKRRVVREALSGHAVKEVETTERDDATRLARDAADASATAVVLLGGDGTASEAANGLLGSSTALAPLPGGSTNVFARTLGLAPRIAPAAAQVADALARGSQRRIPVGTANGRVFLFHVGVGFDAAVVAEVERRGSLKRKIGQAVFVYAAFATYFRHYDHSRPRFAVRFADGTPVDDGYFLICLNSNPYTYLGRRRLTVTPDAVEDRGLVSVTVRSLSVGNLLGVFASAVGSGRRLRANPKVDYRSDLQALEVEGHGPVPYQVDGDYLGEAQTLSIQYHPDALRVVAP